MIRVVGGDECPNPKIRECGDSVSFSIPVPRRLPPVETGDPVTRLGTARSGASLHFSYWSWSASRPAGPIRQESAEERSSATVEALDAAGGPAGRDPKGRRCRVDRVRQTACPMRCIAPRGLPALSTRQRRADRDQYEKCRLERDDMKSNRLHV